VILLGVRVGVPLALSDPAVAEFCLVSGLESLSREDLLALIALQQRQIEELKATVAEQAARIAQLERRLGRNSGNSSMPPSSDVFHKPERPAAPKSGRRRGNQPGAGGGGLALVEHPDETEHAFPDACQGCGALFDELGEVDSLGYSRRQRTDIPPVCAQVIETRFHRVACGCGAVTGAPVPAEVSDTPTYGPNLAAFTVYLLVYQHVPVARAAELIADLTGAAPSTGWVAAQLVHAAELVQPALALIRALLTLGHVLHADETTTRIGTDRRRYLHVACTRLLTYLALAPRSRAGVNSLGILPQFRGTLIHDAYFQLYDGYPHAYHQLCLAHVIRELTAQVEAYPEQAWADQIRWALSRLIEQAAAARAAGLDHVPPELGTVYLRVLRQGVAVGLSLHPRMSANGAQSDATNLLERLREREHEYLRFLEDTTIEPTNNLAERDQRPVKTQVKISGCHQSETGAANWLAVRSYISSAIKHGIGTYAALRAAMNGEPWMPPIALTP
jgi:transposase